MRKIFILLLACFFAVSLNAQKKFNVLFIGNSYTYVNGLPTMIEQLALAGGDSLTHDQSTPGGYTFEGHSTNATTLSKIAQGDWDYVVLQEQSQKPSFPPAQVQSDVYPFAAILDSLIHDANPCTETMFYMTWGRKYGDQQNCQFYTPLCTFDGMQGRLTQSYLEMGDMFSATVAPVGLAWQASMRLDSMIELYQADYSHPSTAGTYLTACVFYGTMYQQQSEGLGWYSILDTATATFLQHVADSIVFGDMEQWNINGNAPMADFSFIQNNDSVFFSDSSANAGSWAWDFGDGNTDTIASPVHVYGASGTYVVTLIIDNGCAQDTLTDTVTVNIVSRDPGSLMPGITISPNPAGDAALVNWPAGLQMREVLLMDVQGRILRRYTQPEGASHQRIRLDDLPAGIYWLRLRSDSGLELSRKLVHGE